MVKQTTGCLWQCRDGNVWLACFAFALVIGLCSGNSLQAADLPVSNSSSPTASVPLEYLETDSTVSSCNVSLTSQTNPFKKEPTVAAGKTYRGILKFDDANSFGFLWQRETGKIYIDLNHNQDLTDDSAGVFSSDTKGRNYAFFHDIRLDLGGPNGKHELLVDVNLYDYGSRPSGNVSLRCYWQGKVSLQGQDWQLGVIPSVLGQTNLFKNSKLLLRPWSQRKEAFATYNEQATTVPFSSNCFLNGHAYALNGVLPQNKDGKFSIQVTEQSVSLGELKLTGQFIKRLVLAESPSKYVVILTQPTNVVKVPTGSYGRVDVLLEHNGAQAYANSDRSEAKSVLVNDKTPAVLDVGGPLTNSVVATRHGQELKMDYQLIGAGGRTYQMTGVRKQPEFAIYKGEKKLTSGTFEFG